MSEKPTDIEPDRCSDECVKTVGTWQQLASFKTECSNDGSVADTSHSSCASAQMQLPILSHHILFYYHLLSYFRFSFSFPFHLSSSHQAAQAGPELRVFLSQCLSLRSQTCHTCLDNLIKDLGSFFFFYLQW